MSLETFWNFIGIKNVLYSLAENGYRLLFGRIKTTWKQLSTFTSRDLSRENTRLVSVASSLDVIRDAYWNTKNVKIMVVCLRIQYRHVVPRCSHVVLET